MKEMNIAEMWETCIKFMWGRTYVLGLCRFFKSHHVNTLLDCGAGTGFPSIELRKLGLDVSYSDNSEVMYNYFKQKLKREGVNMPHYLCNWVELSSCLDRQFDAILCRGNSLIY